LVRQKARIRRPTPLHDTSADNSPDTQRTAPPSAATHQPNDQSHHQPPNPLITGAALRTNDLPTLRAHIGNRATVLAVQRQPGPGGPQ
jgi:hypothetical protein